MQLGLACSCVAMLAAAVTAHSQEQLPLVDSVRSYLLYYPENDGMDGNDTNMTHCFLELSTELDKRTGTH